ncbi:DoxX family protein [Acidobacterium sp. S8]|uniref:DoxX family protein n=1 Tax=Acidobacterium sp. S8 TaxID=1641854 RepID=UPI00131D530A|nr:DoxX family protein [Acidobacterium sp. S8]
MNILLWVLQIVTALLYAASGLMKLFFFDKVTKDVPSFGVLPRPVWTALGILELLGTIALILPGLLKSYTGLTAIAAVVLCFESLLFIWVHIKYTEKTPIVMSVVLGVVMAFIAYGRFALSPL